MQFSIQYIRRSVKYHMLENQQSMLNGLSKILENKQITEVRILNKEGKITASSIIEKGCLVDKNSEGCMVVIKEVKESN